MPHSFDPRKFMQLAIEEMKKSVDESRTDGKASPKVGAVLVTADGKVLATAHRGEIRNGDHAEYTLLDKKLRDTDVTGCYLFATLEPCALGSRKHPKSPCAERIVNARIKKVWVGIGDPDPTVDRKGLKYLEDSGVEVEMFDKEFQPIIEHENKEFLKQATQRAEEVSKPKSVQLSQFENVIPESSTEEFSLDALKHYIRRAELNLQADSPELFSLLEQQQLIQVPEVTKTDSQVEELRRNDVKPIFDFAGHSRMNRTGEIKDTYKNNGERATLMSFNEYGDNGAYIQFPTGSIDKEEKWIMTGKSKTGDADLNNLNYHIDIIYQDKDARTYKQELWRKGLSAGRVGSPILISEPVKKYIPTGLGILLFGKNPRLRYPQAVLKVESRFGNGEPEIHDFDEALVLIPDRVEEWLKRVLSSKISRKDFARTTEYDFPIEVLREAIINAIVHRDYDIEGAKCYLTVYDDKIVVKSPGQPVKPIKFEDFQMFKAPSLSRNPKLMAVFSAMHYVEERGIGMTEMKSMPERYQLSKPIITWEEPYLTISFPRNHFYLETIIGRDTFNQLNEEERNGLIYIRDEIKMSKTDYAKHFDFNDKKAQRHLAKFIELGLVKLTGKGPASKYTYIRW